MMKNIIKKVKSSTFAITNDEKIIGTCFAIKKDGILLTACHVVMSRSGSMRENLKIIDANNDYHEFKIIDSEKSLDIAFLESSSLSLTEFLEIGDYDDIEEGENILLCGFPFGSKYHITHKGMVSAKGIINGRESIQVDASVNQGNSGGPCIVFNNDKIQVIGIIVTKLAGVDLQKIKKSHSELKAAMQGYRKKEDVRNLEGEERTKAQFIHIFCELFDILSPIVSDLDRFVNVGFGEAVSINYVKEWLDLNNT